MRKWKDGDSNADSTRKKAPARLPALERARVSVTHVGHQPVQFPKKARL